MMDDIRKIPPKQAPRPFPLTGGEPVFLPTPRPESSRYPKKQERSFLPKALLATVLGVLLLAIGIAGFFLFKGVTLGERMQFDNSGRHSFTASLKSLADIFRGGQHAPLRGEDTGRINILLLGRAGERYPGKNLTDTVMLMSIDTKTKQVALLSLPRDLYVPIGKTALFTKLNSLYQYGLSGGEGVAPLEETIETITGEPVHYFVTLDFDGFEKIVDTLGGISVDVPRDFTDTRYPGKNYSYETFEIKKGWQTLDGATTLKYVRERHDDPEGDFGRARRQQQVIQAMKDKAFSLDTLLNITAIDRLVTTLGDSVKTDMPLEDMARFLDLVRVLDTKNVTTAVIDAWKKESLLRVSHVQVGSIAAFILVPRVGNWSEIEDASRNIFHRDEEERRKQAIKAENPSLTVYFRAAERGAAEKIAAFAREELGFSTVTAVLSPLDNPLEKSIMVERSGQAKPFSLDELLKRFSLTPTLSLPFAPPRGPESDFSIVIGADLAETFSLKETFEGPLPEDNSFSEPLPPQPKKKQ